MLHIRFLGSTSEGMHVHISALQLGNCPFESIPTCWSYMIVGQINSDENEETDSSMGVTCLLMQDS